MKKILIVLLIALAMVSPAFAYEKGDLKIDVDAKVGIGLGTEFGITNDDITSYFDMKIPFIIGADVYYRLLNNLSLGIGFNHIFNSESKSDIGDLDKFKMGATNIFAVVKPEIQFDNLVFKSFYGLAQCGVTIPHEDSKGIDDTECGVYYGFGIGAEFAFGIILEGLYTGSFYQIEPANNFGKYDAKYNTFMLNIGYKYSF